MSLKRKEFLLSSMGAAAAIASFSPLSSIASSLSKSNAKGSKAKLNLSFGEGTAPGETLEERLDFMEEYGIVGLEPNGGRLKERVKEFNTLLNGRNIKIGAICAGFKGFIISSDEPLRKLFDSTMREIIQAAGELGSIGVVMVPAFNSQKPCMPHTSETREFLVKELATLGAYARSCGTSIILEPLNRREAHYMRLVSDAASLCRDANEPGVKCMGDFWHMKWEETSDYGAFHSAGVEYLQHVHVASKGNRKMPGEDGELDTYIDGFRALKELNYNKYVSFECGSIGDKAQTVPAAVKLLREQWKKA